MKKRPYVLTIAGSDSCSGAGIQADLKTFTALGCEGLTCITALTAQNPHEVRNIFPISPSFVGEQLDALFEVLPIQAVKIGMIHSEKTITCVAQKLARYHPPFVVLDPVMVASSGDRLLAKEAICTLKSALFPLSTLITPNLAEAENFLQQKIENKSAMERAAVALQKQGAKAVLLKGGHLKSAQASDCLASTHIEWLEKQPIVTTNTHGTGCKLSSAIAAYLALGYSLQKASLSAKEYVYQTFKEERAKCK